jgi:hypothetical protein
MFFSQTMKKASKSLKTSNKMTIFANKKHLYDYEKTPYYPPAAIRCHGDECAEYQLY